VKTQRPITAQDEHRVLKFRPRSSVHPPGWREDLSREDLGREDLGRREDLGQRENLRKRDDLSKQAQPEDDLARYERDRDEPDDFRHRMLANVAAFAFTVALTAIGIWLAMSIADLRKTQDCVLMGRRDCAHISAPHS
jgi:hypothetical protein